jgi:hypothetical protein
VHHSLSMGIVYEEICIDNPDILIKNPAPHQNHYTSMLIELCRDHLSGLFPTLQLAIYTEMCGGGHYIRTN